LLALVLALGVEGVGAPPDGGRAHRAPPEQALAMGSPRARRLEQVVPSSTSI
jgi:hypothetical protein